jgi:DNA polymerase I
MPPTLPQDAGEAQTTLYLVDGSAYIYRAYHAIRTLSNSKGMPTNAVYGFTRMLIKLIQDRCPEHVAIFFDAKGPTFRHRLFNDYKATRPSTPDDLAMQLPYIKRITAAFNIPVIEKEGFEADDLIGTYARRAEADGFSVVMVTGDKDFMQLITPRVSMWDPMKDIVVDLAHIAREFALQPDQLIDVMGLAGDTSDNVPGVPGIGPKTALKLIQTFGSITALYERIAELKSAKQRENLILHREQALLSRRLVTVDTAVPVDFNPAKLKARSPDEAELARLFQELEFRELQQQYQQTAERRPTCYTAVLNGEDLAALVVRLKAAGRFSLDTETTSLNPMRAVLVGISVAMGPCEAYYVACGHRYIGAPSQLSCSEMLAALKPVLEDPGIAKVGQNVKYDWIVLKRHGICLKGVVFDTMVGSYLLNPSKRAHSLNQIALDYLNHKSITFSEVAGKGKNMVTFDQVDLEQAVPYACEDADLAFRASEILEQELTSLGLGPLLEEVEMPLIPVLTAMEMTGVCLDQEKLRELSHSFERQLQQLESDIHRIAGEPFNIQSAQQLGYILFEKMGLPTFKKTKKKTGYSTDVDVLMRLAEQHELPALILRHRSLAKLKSTYADALLEQIEPRTGRIHTSYNQTVAATGRLSSSDPNLQNIPIRTEEGREIRKAFIPQPGWVMLSADYSQIELRILAHVAQDPILIEGFRSGQDIHARTASEVFMLPLDEVSDELRRQAKVINFGIIYGMSAFGLSRELGITPKMAQIYIDQYFQRYHGVKAYIDQTILKARRDGSISTLLGRHRLLPDINSQNAVIRQFAERTAVNMPIQGTAADLIKLAMIRTAAAITEARLEANMLLSVHDEIVFEVAPPALEILKETARRIMENVWDLSVPLKVNLSWGANWADAH